MAVKVLTPVKGEVNKITPFALEAPATASEGFEFQIPRAITEEYLVIVAYNGGGSAANLTLKKPENGSYAAASDDEVVSLEAGKYAQIRIESARFADNKGMGRGAGATDDVKGAVLE